MTIANLSLNDHIRRLTYDVSLDLKIESLDKIYETNIIDDKTVRAVLMSLNDKSEDDRLRTHGVRLINEMLKKSDLPEEKDCIMRHLMTRIFGQYYDQTVIAHRDLFGKLVSTLESNIYEMDHLFSWLMQEVTKVQEINFNTKLPAQVAEFFETDHNYDSLRSKAVFKEISNERHLVTLYNNQVPISTLHATLEVLGKRKINEINFELIGAHLSPIVNLNHKGAKEVVHMALGNIEAWAKNFPKSFDDLNAQTVSIHKWHKKKDKKAVDDITWKQIGMNNIFMPELVSALVNPGKNVCDTARLFDVLKYFNGIRSWRKDYSHLRKITAFILEARNEKEETNFPFSSAIQFLKSHLTGLDLYKPTKEDESKTDRFRKGLLSKLNLDADNIIKQTLLQISQNTNLKDSVRSEAWGVIISSFPADLLELLIGNIEEIKLSGTILNGVLKNLEDINAFSTFAILEDLWKQKDRYDLTTAKQIASTLGAIGSYDIISLLMPTVFEDGSTELRAAVKEILITHGFTSEVERETFRRDILKSHQIEKQVLTEIVNTETSLKSSAVRLKKTQVDINEKNFELTAAGNEIDNFTVLKKLELAESAIELSKLKGKTNIVLREIGKLESEIAELSRRLENKVDKSNNALEQARSLERKIEEREKELKRTEEKIEDEERNISNLEARIKKSNKNLDGLNADLKIADGETNQFEKNLHNVQVKFETTQSKIRNLESQARGEKNDDPAAYNTTKSRIKSIKRELDDLKSGRKAAEKALSKHNSKIDKLQRKLESERRSIDDNTDAIQRSNRNIEEYEHRLVTLKDEIARYKSDHKNLAKKIRKINIDIDEYRNEIGSQKRSLNELKSELNRLNNELSEIRRRNDNITNSAENGLRERQAKIDSLQSDMASLIRQHEQINSNIVSDENKLQHLKTELQTLIQKRESDRNHFDELADRSNTESNYTDVRNHNRSHLKLMSKREGDEIVLANDKIFERGVEEFSRRNPSTKKITKKINEK